MTSTSHGSPSVLSPVLSQSWALSLLSLVMLFQMEAPALFEEATSMSHVRYSCFSCYWVFLGQLSFLSLHISGIVSPSGSIKIFSFDFEHFLFLSGCEFSRLSSPGVTFRKQCDCRYESELCPCSCGFSVTFEQTTLLL